MTASNPKMTMKFPLLMLGLAAALLLGASSAFAQSLSPNDPVDKVCLAQPAACIAALRADRAAYLNLIDSLRVQLGGDEAKIVKLESDAAAKDEYWRKWFGLDNKPEKPSIPK